MTSLLNNDDTGAADAQAKQTIKQLFVDVAANLEIGDISSVKLISSVLSVLTESTDQVSDLAASTALEKSVLLSKCLVDMSRNNGFEFLKQAANKIIDTSANTLLSSGINGSDKYYQSTEQILNYLVNMSSLHLSINQHTHVKSKSIDLKVSRTMASNLLDKNISLQGGHIQLPILNSSSLLMLKSFSQIFKLCNNFSNL
ncbi:hypothetical protein BpHYR1_031045 [Brachionus plicatilis]|uniref:Uncharacterized protein n=1 Tax=Brachionus plicatilis TaxID=10195 RepID=A0A3M7RKK3_BRAPC|nr:hypothetical protein BpHYR1_031045 [Brachionus plicatilis]